MSRDEQIDFLIDALLRLFIMHWWFDKSEIQREMLRLDRARDGKYEKALNERNKVNAIAEHHRKSWLSAFRMGN